MLWNFNEYANNIALIDENGISITYSELNSEAKRIIDTIGNRCLVFSLCTNSIGSVIGYTAFLNNQIVPVLLNSQMDADLLKNLMDTYQPKFIWIPTSMADRFSSYKSIYDNNEYQLLKTDYVKEYPLYDDLGLLLTTSGSTGSPKFVRQSYSNIKANAESIALYLRLDASERPITTLPMNYTYGLSIINSHLLVGATVLLTDHTLMQKEFWNFLKIQNATSFGGVPYTYEMLERLRFFRMDLPSLRTMTQAGGKLSPELHKKFAEYAYEKGKQFIVMYGQCEATARMSYLPYDRSIEKYGSMGIAIPGGKFTIIDEEGNEISESEVTGELVYEGPNVTLGYAMTGNDLANGDERSGRLITGDMAKRDSDGFYYIVGRKKRFLKLYGNRVNLDELDRMIKDRFNYIDCASSGVDDHMYIFVTNPEVIEQVRTFVAEKTGINKVAFHIVVIDEIPKNDAGKTLYKELSMYYE